LIPADGSKPETWNENQNELQRLLSPSGDFQEGVSPFRNQHATVHPAQLSAVGTWPFPVEILKGLAEPEPRRIPPGGDLSIARVLWQLSRIEDVTMDMLIAGRPWPFFE
jgi:hypothetical protein